MTTSGETVWILPRTVGDPDAHGNAVETWPDKDDPSAVKVEGVKVAPSIAPGTAFSRGTAEPARDAVVTLQRIYLPAGSPQPDPLDHMWVRDHVYEVIGEAGVWVNPWRQAETGIEIALNRVEG